MPCMRPAMSVAVSTVFSGAVMVRASITSGRKAGSPAFAQWLGDRSGWGQWGQVPPLRNLLHDRYIGPAASPRSVGERICWRVAPCPVRSCCRVSSPKVPVLWLRVGPIPTERRESSRVISFFRTAEGSTFQRRFRPGHGCGRNGTVAAGGVLPRSLKTVRARGFLLH